MPRKGIKHHHTTPKKASKKKKPSPPQLSFSFKSGTYYHKGKQWWPAAS